MSLLIESMKTTFMETVSTGVLDKNKKDYLRSKDKGEKTYDVSRHIRLHMSKYKKNEDLQSILCQNLQPNCCSKVNFQKVDQHTGGKWLIHDTKVEWLDVTWRGPMAPCWIRYSERRSRGKNILGGERLQNAKYLVSKCSLKQIPKVTSILVVDYLS